ncbi:hypothetical protein FKM82_019403 [Ascaphus truei]
MGRRGLMGMGKERHGWVRAERNTGEERKGLSHGGKEGVRIRPRSLSQRARTACRQRAERHRPRYEVCRERELGDQNGSGGRYDVGGGTITHRHTHGNPSALLLLPLPRRMAWDMDLY